MSIKKICVAILMLGVTYLFFFCLTPLAFPESYLFIKYLHILSIICWMAGLFYLPRLYAYHSGSKIHSESSDLFKIMERKLIKIIMNPSMILSWLTGLWLAYHVYAFSGGWLHIKIFFVLILSMFHGFLSYHRRQLAEDKRLLSEKTWKLLNEFPTLLLLIIVYCVVFKPLS